jgi:hypothetical protein
MSEKLKHIPNPEGRPKKLRGGRDRTIYIDDESWEKAKLLGNGKPSEGIRRALAHYTLSPQPSA